MAADHRDHRPGAAQDSRFALHARDALRKAIVYYGWDHPVVAAAQETVIAIGRSDRVLHGGTPSGVPERPHPLPVCP